MAIAYLKASLNLDQDFRIELGNDGSTDPWIIWRTWKKINVLDWKWNENKKKLDLKYIWNTFWQVIDDKTNLYLCTLRVDYYKWR